MNRTRSPIVKQVVDFHLAWRDLSAQIALTKGKEAHKT